MRDNPTAGVAPKKGWSDEERDAYYAQKAEAMTQSSQPIKGTNLGARPLGLQQAINRGNSAQNTPKRMFGVPLVEESNDSPSLIDRVMGGIAQHKADQAADVAQTRQVNAAMGLQSGLSQAEMPVVNAVVGTANALARPIYQPALAALQGFDWAWENIVAEPLATVALATNKNNPVFKDGIQPGDVFGMWSAAREAANDTSWGVAMNTNQFVLAASSSPITKQIPGIGILFGLTDMVAPILENVNPFDPASVKDAQDKYMAFNAITGATDFGLNLLPIPGGKGVGALRRVTGLSNKVREADRAVIASDWELHKSWVVSGGAEGHETNIGKQIMEIADSNDRGFILTRPIVKNQSGAAKGKLSALYSKTQDPEAVFDLFQASIGDTKAMQRLADSGNADLVYSLGNMNDGIGALLSGGRKYHPDETAVHYFDQAHRDAVAREEWSRDLYKTFLDDNNVFTVLGDWAPMGGNGRILPSIAKPVARVVESGRIAKADVNAALATGKQEYLPAVAEHIIQTTPDGPVRRLLSIRPGALQWSFAYRPLNVVSFSGSRPDDVIEEAYAVMNQIDGLRFGQRIPVGDRVAQDGSIERIYMTAEEFRQKHITAITDAMSHEGDAVVQAYQKMEDEIAYGMAMAQDVSFADAQRIIAGVRDKAGSEFESLRVNGYFLDDRNGMRVDINPTTIRGLRNAYYTLPLNEIEAALKSEAHHVLRRPAQTIGDGGRAAFEFGSQLFRTNMLVKPGYTFRNSILEPMVTTLIAHGAQLFTTEGADMFINGVYNFGKNNVRRAARATVGFKDMAKSSRLTAKQHKAVDEYVRTMDARDALTREILKKNIMESPQAQAELAEIQDELNVLDHFLEMTVNDLVDQGIATAAISLRVPSLHKLKTETDTMAAVARDPLNTQPIIDDAENKALYFAGQNNNDMFEYWSARAEVLKAIAGMNQQERDEIITSMGTLTKDLRSLAKRVPTIDKDGHHSRVAILNDKLEDMQDRLLELRQQHAVVKARRERRATPYLQGEGTRTKTLENGNVVTVGEAFHGSAGRAYRADSSSGLTNRQAMDTSAHNMTVMNMMFSRFKRGRTGSVSVNDPHYFESIHEIAANQFAGDKLFNMMATEPKAVVVAWANSADGRRYFSELGVNGKKYMKDIDEAYYVFNKMFPTREAQDLLASGREFSVGELQSALLTPDPTGAIPRLADIVGQEIDYVVPSSMFHEAGSLYKKSLDRIWDYFATQPETRLARWPYYVRQFDTDLTERMNVLARQGIDVDLAVANAQRRAAHVSTLANLERTFYNIRRYRNPVYTARFIMAFPGAFVNSISRYAYYLPSHHPAEMMTLLNVANSTFNAISVDENGQHTGLANAKYILLPGTGTPPGKNGITQDAGVRIPIDALTRIFLDNPGRSWLTAVTTDSVLNMRPELDKVMKEHLPDYLTAFLQNAEPPKTEGGEWSGGPQPGDLVGVMSSSLFANWQRSIVNWWQGEGSQKYLQDWGFAWQNVQAEHLRSGNTSPVTEDEVNEVVDGWTALRVLVQFASPTSYQVDAPGQLERDTWFRLQNENPDLSFEDLQQKFYQTLGGDADDPITAAKRGEWGKPYTMSTSKDTYGMNNTYTVEGMSQVEKYPSLASALGERDKELVGLLAVGQGGSYSRAVYNAMAIKKPYDSAVEPYRSKKMPAEYLRDWNAAQGWDEFSISKTRYVEARKMASDAGDRDLVQRIDDSWYFYQNNDDPAAGKLGLRYRNPDWASKKDGLKTNEAGQIELALLQIKGNKEFMADRGKDSDWQSVFTMLDRRKDILDQVNALGQTDEDNAFKRELKDYFVSFYNEKSLENPLLMDLWDRYFASEWETD